MTNAVLWLLTVEALGLLAFPAAYALFPALRDRGFGFAKPLGMLMLALPVWWLGSAHVPLGPRATAVLVFAVLAVAAALLARRMWPELAVFVRREWRLLLATEAVFLAVFIVWALLRAGMPGIQHTEQPMDFAFLNASMIAATFPPGDPWLSGHGISYYYFGYLTMGLPGVLSDIPSGYVYNLALALLPAMAAMGVVSLVTSVAVRLGATLLTGFGVGLLGALMLGFLGNLEGVFELLRAWGIGAQGFWDAVGIKGLDAPAAGASLFPSDHWWWWRSSRVIDTVVEGISLDPTIHEYPFFSWFLGDLHPHVMSIPFVLLFMAFTYVLLMDKTPLNGDWWRRRWPFVLAMGLSLGALGFINAWDLPVFLAVGAGAAVLRAYRSARDGEGRPVAWAVGVAGSLLLLAIVPYLPYYAGSLAGQVKGIALVTTPGTSLLHFLIVWGVFALAVAAVALSLRSRAPDEPSALSLSKGNRPVVIAASLGRAPLGRWLGPGGGAGGPTAGADPRGGGGTHTGGGPRARDRRDHGARRPALGRATPLAGAGVAARVDSASGRRRPRVRPRLGGDGRRPRAGAGALLRRRLLRQPDEHGVQALLSGVGRSCCSRAPDPILWNTERPARRSVAAPGGCGRSARIRRLGCGRLLSSRGDGADSERNLRQPVHPRRDGLPARAGARRARGHRVAARQRRGRRRHRRGRGRRLLDLRARRLLHRPALAPELARPRAPMARLERAAGRPS
ncbi:MAG: DUF2298 domain-containing protein [Chloroflexota bacterium]|nr:DUF2298 domain-containing protein [Chloroflexota bacterium]